MSAPIPLSSYLTSIQSFRGAHNKYPLGILISRGSIKENSSLFVSNFAFNNDVLIVFPLLLICHQVQVEMEGKKPKKKKVRSMTEQCCNNFLISFYSYLSVD